MLMPAFFAMKTFIFIITHAWNPAKRRISFYIICRCNALVNTGMSDAMRLNRTKVQFQYLKQVLGVAMLVLIIIIRVA
jgi:hypothetical protein